MESPPDVDYVDPPDIPVDERMTDAEFRVIREYLGLTGQWIAQHLQVNERTVRAWEAGRYPIPEGVRLAIERLEADTGAFVSAAIDALMDLPEPGVVTYRSDQEYHAANPGIGYPVSWHRAAIARIAQDVPGLVIAYADQNPATLRL
jgi:DNA-binding XRE family transcriptional regulator